MRPKKIPLVVWLSWAGWFVYGIVTHVEVTGDAIKKRSLSTVYSRKVQWIFTRMMLLFLFGVVILPSKFAAPFLYPLLSANVQELITAVWFYVTGVGFAWWFCLWRAKHVENPTPFDMKRLWGLRWRHSGAKSIAALPCRVCEYRFL